jgi:hypothetical protein
VKQRFVVDFRIAAEERNSLLSEEWFWPVAQNEYDSCFREYVDWAHAFPAQLAHDHELRMAYELFESDILKDLAAIFGTWVDVSTAKQNQLNLVYHEDQHLYRMLDENRFDSHSPLDEARNIGETRLRDPKRIAARFLRKNVNNAKTIFRGRPNVHSISANMLVRQLTAGRSSLLRLAYADLANQRARKTTIHPELLNLAETISSKAIETLDSHGHSPTKELANYIGTIVNRRLTSAWHDRDYTPGFQPTFKMTLFAGTGGNYLARVVGNSFQKRGANVIRTTHGGETILFDHPLWSPIELPLADTYVTYGSASAKSMNILAEKHRSLRKTSTPARIVAGGSKHHANIINAATPGKDVRKVIVIAAAFTGTRRAIPNVKLHDVVYYEWHRRLLAMVKSNGFEVISKRHPKGLGAADRLYDDVATTELRQVGMQDIFESADAFVMDIAGSAFLESACTLKPVVLIDIPNRTMTDEGRKAIEKSIEIVPATFDDQNRVIVDPRNVADAIRKPVDIDARRKLLVDYLTQPDQQLLDILDSTFN